MRVSMILTALAVTAMAMPQGRGRGGRNRGDLIVNLPDGSIGVPANQAPADNNNNQDNNDNADENNNDQQAENNNNNQQAEENNNDQQAEEPPADDAPAEEAPAEDAPAQEENADAGNNNNNGGGIDPALVPDFGVERGVQLEGTGDCVGSVEGVPIPCTCPPSVDEFVSRLTEFQAAGQTPAGAPVDFPTGDSNQDQIGRINTAIVVLQSITGQAGVGCPAASTTLLAQRAALEG